MSIGNESRGLCRFQSLLSMFNLNDRLVSPKSNITHIPIPNWDDVNKIKSQWQKKSMEFLHKTL